MENKYFNCWCCKEPCELSEMEKVAVDVNEDGLFCEICIAGIVNGEIKLPQKPLWWGYKHKNGSYQAKRYWSQEDVDEAYASPFCVRVFVAFPADGREDALIQIQSLDEYMQSKLGGGEHD